MKQQPATGSYKTPPVVQAILDGLDFAEVRRISSLPDRQAELAVRIHRAQRMTPSPMVVPLTPRPEVTVLADEARSHSASGIPPVGDPPPRRRPAKPGWYPPIVPPSTTGLLAVGASQQPPNPTASGLRRVKAAMQQQEQALDTARAEADLLFHSAGIELVQRIVFGVVAAVVAATFSLATGLVLQ